MDRKFSGSEVPAWAQEAIDQTLAAAPAAPSPLSHRANPNVWAMFVEAALVAAFDPKTLSPEIPTGPERTQAERILLSFSQRVYEEKGYRWALREEARIAIVDELAATSELTSAIERSAPSVSDPVTMALRDPLQAKPLEFASMDLPALENARTALASVNGARKIPFPP